MAAPTKSCSILLQVYFTKVWNEIQIDTIVQIDVTEFSGNN